MGAYWRKNNFLLPPMATKEPVDEAIHSNLKCGGDGEDLTVASGGFKIQHGVTLIHDYKPLILLVCSLPFASNAFSLIPDLKNKMPQRGSSCDGLSLVRIIPHGHGHGRNDRWSGRHCKLEIASDTLSFVPFSLFLFYFSPPLWKGDGEGREGKRKGRCLDLRCECSIARGLNGRGE